MKTESGNIKPKMVKSAKKWGEIVTPAFKELFDNGIIAFVYPMSDYFIDSAESDAIELLQNWSGLDEYMKKKWKITHEEKIDIEKIVPFMYYFMSDDKTEVLTIRDHIINEKQSKIVSKIMKKYFGKKYVKTKETTALNFSKKSISHYDKSIGELICDGIKKNHGINVKLYKKPKYGEYEKYIQIKYNKKDEQKTKEIFNNCGIIFVSNPEEYLWGIWGNRYAINEKLQVVYFPDGMSIPYTNCLISGKLSF